MNVIPRRNLEDVYLVDNRKLAIKLLDAEASRSLGLVETIEQLEAELEQTRNQREQLREQFIDLQVQIGDLIPPAPGERANDPIIKRVQRVSEAISEILRLHAEVSEDYVGRYHMGYYNSTIKSLKRAMGQNPD